MLNKQSITPYLQQHRLLDLEHPVEGSVRISDVSQRNTNFRVECDQAPSYLVKHGAGLDRASTVAHEAAIYRALDGSTSMRRYVPRFYAYDPGESALVLELIEGAETLAERQARTGRFSVESARQFGGALAELHAISPEDNPDLYDVLGRSIYGGRPHWTLSVHRPYLREYGLSSNANIQTVKILQRFPDFGAALDALRHEWMSPVSHVPIHCDIKWGNILVRPSSSQTVRLVDWELARLGDPCWDVGSFFGEYLTFWLLSIPVTGQDPPDRFLDLARYPLDKMRPAMRAFWLAYTTRLGIPANRLDGVLLRSVRYAGARLIQTAYEQGQTSALLTSNIVVLLQLALNILQRPAEAAIMLLGIPLSPISSFTRPSPPQSQP